MARRTSTVLAFAWLCACGDNTISIEQGAGGSAGGGADTGAEDQDSATGQSSAVTLTGGAADGDSTDDGGGSDAGDDTLGDGDSSGDESTTGEPAMPRWVAVGPEVLAYSTDSGRSWQPAASGATGRYYDAATDGLGNWVAVGGNNVNFFTVDMALSTDGGENWSALEAPVIAPLYAVTHAEGLWSALGARDSNLIVSGTHATDPAQVWTDGSFMANGGGISSMAYAEGTWVGVGVSFAVTSTNGQDWTLTDSNVPLFSVTHGDGQWVAIGPGSVRVADDPTGEWTLVAEPMPFTKLCEIAYGEGRWVIVGHEGILWADDPAGPWTYADTETNLRANGVRYDPASATWGVVGGWPGGGSTPLALYSEDGAQTWEPAVLWDDDLEAELLGLTIEMP